MWRYRNEFYILKNVVQKSVSQRGGNIDFGKMKATSNQHFKCRATGWNWCRALLWPLEPENTEIQITPRENEQTQGTERILQYFLWNLDSTSLQLFNIKKLYNLKGKTTESAKYEEIIKKWYKILKVKVKAEILSSFLVVL